MDRYTASLFSGDDLITMASTKAASSQEASERLAEAVDQWLDDRAIPRPQAYALVREQHIVAINLALEDTRAKSARGSRRPTDRLQ